MDLEKTVLITGGSSGIGYSISRYFAKDGFRLLWVSLEQTELDTAQKKLQQEIDGCQVHTLAKDLSHTSASEEVYKWVQENKWKVDVLVNNAGFGNYGFVKDLDIDKEVRMINLNVINLYKMTKLFLDDMVKADSGTIINISSNSSFQPLPKLNTYASTKAFVAHFTRGITEELKILKSKVKAVCVCPAAISDTNFKKVGKMENIKTFSGLATTTAAEVAKDVWRAYKKGKNFMVSGRKMRLLHTFFPLIPYSVQQFLVRMEIKEVS